MFERRFAPKIGGSTLVEAAAAPGIPGKRTLLEAPRRRWYDEDMFRIAPPVAGKRTQTETDHGDDNDNEPDDEGLTSPR